MKFEFDPEKDKRNLEKHGISLARAHDFSIVRVLEDTRFEYGEERWRAFGTIDDKGYCLVFTIRHEPQADEKKVIRVISLRRAREKELKRYVSQI